MKVKSKADVEIATIKTFHDYKAAEQKVAEKIKARKAAKEAYDKAVADLQHRLILSLILQL